MNAAGFSCWRIVLVIHVVCATRAFADLAISAGGQQSLALRKDGTLVQWGLTNAAIPNSAWGSSAAIACGTNFSLALLTNGTVVAWGTNTVGTNVPTGLNGGPLGGGKNFCNLC